MSFNPLTDILAAGGINFKGAWNADANTPILTSGMGTAGNTIDLLPFQVLSGWPASMHLVSGPSNWYRI